MLVLLGSELPSTIIFVTAYDEYALRAFEAGALDCLLKPFGDARFHRLACTWAVTHTSCVGRCRDSSATWAWRTFCAFTDQSLLVSIRFVHWNYRAAVEYVVVLKSQVRLRLSRRFRRRLQDPLGAASQRDLLSAT